jgi:hypothetical protein
MEVRREAISTLLRDEGLKPRMGLMRGRPGALSVAGRGVCGCEAADGACSSSPVEIDCCCATQSVVDELEFEFSTLYDRWVIIVMGGPFPNSSTPFLLFLPGTFRAFGALGVRKLEFAAVEIDPRAAGLLG